MSEIKPTQSQDERMEHYLRFLQASQQDSGGVSLHNQSNAGAASTKTAGVPALIVGGIRLSAQTDLLGDDSQYNCPECHAIMTPSLNGVRAAGTSRDAALSCDACGHTPRARRTSQFRTPSRQTGPTTDFLAAREHIVMCPACSGAHMNPVDVGGSIQMFCDNPGCGHMEPSQPL